VLYLIDVLTTYYLVIVALCPDGSQSVVVPMKETTWYKNDSFGLRTLDEAGKVSHAFVDTPVGGCFG